MNNQKGHEKCIHMRNIGRVHDGMQKLSLHKEAYTNSGRDALKSTTPSKGHVGVKQAEKHKSEKRL